MGKDGDVLGEEQWQWLNRSLCVPEPSPLAKLDAHFSATRMRALFHDTHPDRNRCDSEALVDIVVSSIQVTTLVLLYLCCCCCKSCW